VSVHGKLSLTSLPHRLATYAQMTMREFGVLAVLLAVGAIAVLVARRGRDLLVILGGVFATELVLAMVVVGARHANGFYSTLVQGGYLHGIWVVVGVLAAVGVWEVAQAASRALAHAAAGVVAMVVVAAVVLVPAVVVHGNQMDRRSSDVAPRFAAAVLERLPRHAALFIYGAEAAFPFWYAQEVEHRRRDVAVVAADGLGVASYRLQAERVLGDLPPRSGKTHDDLIASVRAVAKKRPLYFDPFAASAVRKDVGYRFDGYTAVFVDGPAGAQPIKDVADARRALGAITKRFLAEPFRSSFPDTLIDWSVARAHDEFARHFVNAGRLDAAETELRTALALYPKDRTALDNLKVLLLKKAG
jgi:hypothetical protein